ncbi:MAG: hypothetical protein ACI4EI_05970 [Muricoprocola sp.]
MKTLYIHIGTPKTATTSLQLFFSHNQNLLQQKGVSFPSIPYKFPGVRKDRNGHFLVGDVFLPDGKRDEEACQKLWQMGMDIVHEEFKKYDNVLLSDENLWTSSTNAKASYWTRLKEDAEKHGYLIKAIVYFRRQDELAASLFSQAIKINMKDLAVRKWEYYKDNMTSKFLDYDKYLQKIADVIGKENVVVRIFEREHFSGNGNTIFSDFLDILGLPFTEEYDIHQEAANPSISGNRQEIQRIINTVLTDNESAMQMTRRAAIQSEQKKDIHNNYSMFSESETKEILKKYEEGNRHIAKEYFGMDGSLFHEDIPQQPVWSPDNPYMYEDIVRYFGSIVLEQQEKIEKLQKQIKELKSCDHRNVPVLQEDQTEDICQQLRVLHNELYRLTKSDAVLRDELRAVKVSQEREQKSTKKKIEDLQQTALFFRLKRKWNHITGK